MSRRKPSELTYGGYRACMASAKDGTVSVAGQVNLVTPTDDYDADRYQKADGVRVAIKGVAMNFGTRR